MTLFINKTSGKYPITVAEIRVSVNAAFGEEVPEFIMEMADVAIVEPVVPPEYNSDTQMLIEGAPVDSPDGYSQTWIVKDIPIVPPPPEANFIPLSTIRARVEKLGLLKEFSGYLFSNFELFTKLYSTEGQMVDPNYEAIHTAFDELNLPQAARDYILAPASAGVPEVEHDVSDKPG